MRRGRRGIAAVAAVTLIGSLAGCTGSEASAGDGEQGFVPGSGTVSRTAVGDRGDPVELRGPRLGGGDFDVAEHRGKVVLINIWGSWCAPCRAEAPALQEAWRILEPRGVQFLGINTKDDSTAAAEAFERRFEITFPSISDPDGTLQLVFRKSLPPRAIPSTIVLDKDGRVAARIVGAGTFIKIRNLVEDVLAEA